MKLALKLKHKIMKRVHKLPYSWDWCRRMLRDASSPAYPVDDVTADFFVGMGSDCRAAEHLRRSSLRICSSPLDWMMRFTLAGALELHRTGFVTFFEEIRELPYGDGHSSRKVEDVRNGMVSIHHFPSALTLEEGHKAYRERAARHFANTHRFLSGAERVGIVTNTTESLENIVAFIEGMSALYPNAGMVHINIRNSGAEKKREVVRLAGGAVVYDYTFLDVGFYERRGIEPRSWWVGDAYEWRRILKRCRRTSRFSPPERATTKKDSYN